MKLNDYTKGKALKWKGKAKDLKKLLDIQRKQLKKQNDK